MRSTRCHATPRGLWAAGLSCLLLTWPALAAEPKAEEAAKPDKPRIHKVRKGDFKEEVKLSGVFEAAKMAEVSVEPEAWSQLKIVQIAAHGARVKKGDVLIQLDVEDLDKALREKAAAVELGALALKQAVEELRALEQSTPEQLAQVERGHKRSLADQDRYAKIDRPMAVKAAEQALKQRRDSLEYTREELRQLEKMYKADELTEETEEIVLKRQKDAVGRAEFAMEQAKLAHEKAMKIDLPRQDEDMASARKAADEAHRSKLVTVPLALSKKRLEVAKMQRDHPEAVQGLADLKKDRGLMTVRAPADGIVYYGQCERGKWTTGAALAGKLIVGGALPAKQVVLTVADAAELLVRTSVPEKELHRLRKGMTGQAVPTGYPDRKLKVELAAFDTVPLPAGQFDATLKVAGKPGPLTAGMTCELTLSAYEKKGVLAVPAAAVRSDGDDPKERFVWLKTPGQPQKRVVKVGRTHEGKTEVIEGLAEGDEVFLDPPK